jgi:ATP-dependent DNA ligase
MSNIIITRIFDTLYCSDKNGKTKEWKIKVDKYHKYSEIIYSYGYIDGKKTEYKLQIDKGKNIGKKNETDHFEQALSEAESRWNKKSTIDKYSTDKHNNIVNIPSPMLAQDYKKHFKKVFFPCFIQPKLDGYRMVYNPEDQKVYSRNGKEYSVLYNSKLYEELKNIDGILDGELYVHNKLQFEDYGILRKKKLTKDDEKILNKMEYHVYDIICSGKIFKDRYDQLCKITKDTNLIKLVPTILCKSKEDIEEHHLNFINLGYEGSIIRNYKGLYQEKFRSYDLLKYKNFDDEEFEIVDYTFEKDVLGKDDKVVVWICKTKDGKKFNVPSKGSREERNELYNRGDEYIGKMLSVQYFGLTSDGIPRFPKTLREGESSIRDDV